MYFDFFHKRASEPEYAHLRPLAKTFSEGSLSPIESQVNRSQDLITESMITKGQLRKYSEEPTDKMILITQQLDSVLSEHSASWTLSRREQMLEKVGQSEASVAAEHLEAFLTRMNSLGLSISRVVRKLGHLPSLAQIFKHCALECAHTPILSDQDKDEVQIQLKFVVHLLKDNPELE